VLPLFIYALLASSTKLQLGPVAPTAILINSALHSVVSSAVTTDASGQETPSQEYIDAAIAMCFLVGVIQLILGALRFGFIASLLSWPVMSGYTSAAGLIIVASQLRDLFGLTAPGGSAFYERLYDAATNLGTAHWQTSLLGLLALAVLLGIKFVRLPGGAKVPAWFPIQLIVVLLGLGLSAGLNFEGTGMAVVGDIPGDIPSPSFPIKSTQQALDLLPGAAVLAVIAYVGSISLAVIFGKDAGEDVDANLELVASGAACVGGSFFSSFVVSGSFTRTAVNADLGAKTPMAGIVTGLLMLGTLLALAPLFTALPNAVLAAMIIASVKSLLKWEDACKLYATSSSDFAQMLATFVLTLGLGIANGIIAAVGLSLALLLYRSFQPRISELGRFPGTDVFMDVQRFPAAKVVKGLTVLRLDGELHFGNVKLLTGHLVALHNRALRLRKAVGLPPRGLLPAAEGRSASAGQPAPLLAPHPHTPSAPAHTLAQPPSAAWRWCRQCRHPTGRHPHPHRGLCCLCQW
jgi:SulP family sulfate permease